MSLALALFACGPRHGPAVPPHQGGENGHESKRKNRQLPVHDQHDNRHSGHEKGSFDHLQGQRDERLA